MCSSDLLRVSIKDETVDLIYLDPPFNSNASYNVLFKGPAGTESAEEALREVVRGTRQGETGTC